jgi:transposase
VLELGRGRRDERRLQGKDDPLDAVRAARAALASEKLSQPRLGQRREALRLLLLARRSAVDVRRRGLAQLRGVIVTALDSLRHELRGLPPARLLERCSRLRQSSLRGPDKFAVRLVLRTLARRIQAATREAAELEREILGHVRALAPRLLDEPGVGLLVAAQVIISWSDPGHVRSEAAFARLAGAAPIPASSGRTIRYRLSRGGAPSSTARCTPSSSADADTTRQGAPTSNGAWPKARAHAKPSACSSDTAHDTSSARCTTRSRSWPDKP